MVLADVPDLTKTHPLWRPVRDACSDLSLERYDMQQDLQQFATVWHWWQREGHEKMTGNQLSDLARYLILYTRGGIYIDIDFLTAKPLTGLSNVIAWQESIIKKYDNTGKQLNGAVLIADKDNQFLKQCIKNVPGVSLKMWEAVGPQLITDTFLRNEFSSDVMKALPAQSFYPVYWREVTLFMEDPSNDFVKKYKAAMAKEDNYGIHLWHKITKEYYPHNGTFFKELLATYSPGVLNVFLELHPDPNQYQKYLASQRKDT
jgi:mannosyltransferase OCH1-like enzyme